MVGSPGAQNWKRLVVADSNEIHGNLFAKCFGEAMASLLGAEDAMNLSVGMGMRHKFRGSSSYATRHGPCQLTRAAYAARP